MGVPVYKAPNQNAMALPRAFDDFVGYALSQRDYELS